MKNPVIAVLSWIAVAGCAATPGAQSPNSSAEQAAVLAAVDQFFLALYEGDGSAMAAMSTEDGMVYVADYRKDPMTIGGSLHTEFFKRVRRGEQRVKETYWSPTVLVRGPIAVVWAPYELRLGDKTSHCGIDTFQFIKQNGEWTLANTVFTAEPDACPELRPKDGTIVRPTWPPATP